MVEVKPFVNNFDDDQDKIINQWDIFQENLLTDELKFATQKEIEQKGKQEISFDNQRFHIFINSSMIGTI
jgi:hypothetical protein